ncbi:MAG: hypothetical protein AB1374_07645 [Bacillota bacterium]
MGWFSKVVSSVKSGYRSLDRRLGGYLPGGISPQQAKKTTTTAKKATTATAKPTAKKTTTTAKKATTATAKPTAKTPITKIPLSAGTIDVRTGKPYNPQLDVGSVTRPFTPAERRQQNIALGVVGGALGAALAPEAIAAGRVLAPVAVSAAQKAGSLVSRSGQAASRVVTRTAPTVRQVAQKVTQPVGRVATTVGTKVAQTPVIGPALRVATSTPAMQVGTALGTIGVAQALTPTKPPGVATTAPTPTPAAPGGARPGGMTPPLSTAAPGVGTGGGWRPASVLPATPGGAPGTGTTSMTTTTTTPGTPTQPEGMQPGQTTQPPAQPEQPGVTQPPEVEQPDWNKMYQEVVTTIDQAAQENIAMTKAWLDQMTATLDQLQAQIMDVYKQQGTVLDPATLAALKSIRDEVDRRRQQLTEEMNRRGLLQSGIWLAEENRILSNQLTAEEQLLAARLSDIQNRMTEALMSFANQRVNIMGQAMQQGMETARWAGGLKISALGDIQARQTEWQKWWQDRLDQQRQEAERARQWQYEQGLERAKTIAGWTGNIPEGYPGAGQPTFEAQQAAAKQTQTKTNTAATNKYIAQIPTYSSFEEAMADFNRYRAIMEGEGADVQQILNTIYAYFGRA